MRTIVKDHLQREVSFEFPPRRVVSLCPSLTETLFALGLDERVVGRTSYCIHPGRRVQNVATVGGTRDVEVKRVRELRPDLVIAAKEENPRRAVETLAETLPVYVANVTDYESALRAIVDLGSLTGCSEQADELVRDIREAFAGLRPSAARRVAYLVWQEPCMAAGRDTYIHSLLEKCGCENVCARLAGRYPEVSLGTLRELAPEWVLLASEPFPFDDAYVVQLGPRIPKGRFVRVDGEMFGWYGSRMLAAAKYLKELAAELDKATSTGHAGHASGGSG